MDTSKRKEGNPKLVEKLNKRFSTIDKIIKDEVFINNVQDEINGLIIQRNKRPKPKQGFKYVRDWYDRMDEAGELNKQFFLANIEDIWLKKSRIRSETRNVIRIICDKAFLNTWNYYVEKEKTVKIDKKDAKATKKST